MANIIAELKEEHSKLLGMLMRVKGMDIRSKEMEEGLTEVKEVLLAHLRKEDSKLYPVLHKAAEKDKELQESLQIFAKDMEKLSQFVLSFFEKYSKEIHGVDFAVDFGKLLTAIQVRIKKEEAILFPAYERLQGPWT